MRMCSAQEKAYGAFWFSHSVHGTSLPELFLEFLYSLFPSYIMPTSSDRVCPSCVIHISVEEFEWGHARMAQLTLSSDSVGSLTTLAQWHSAGTHQQVSFLRGFDMSYTELVHSTFCIVE